MEKPPWCFAQSASGPWGHLVFCASVKWPLIDRTFHDDATRGDFGFLPEVLWSWAGFWCSHLSPYFRVESLRLFKEGVCQLGEWSGWHIFVPPPHTRSCLGGRCLGIAN